MEVFTEIKPNLFKEGSAVALGFFDGVHIGHAEIIKSSIDFGKENSLTSCVATFSNHPHAIITGQAPQQLTIFEDKVSLIEKLGVDAMLALEFDSKLRHMSAQDYFTKVLVDCLGAKFISIGYDHTFGFNQEGTPDKLKEWGKKLDIKVHVTSPININEEPVSSTRIRKNIKAGKIISASSLLKRNHFIVGKVTQGLKRGTEIGFPTANLMIPSNLVIPAVGVYAGYATIQESVSSIQESGSRNQDSEEKKLPCVVNIGHCPTFKDEISELKVETHIMDFEYRELYKEKVKLEFVKRLRDETKFKSKDELVEQIKLDVKNARDILKK